MTAAGSVTGSTYRIAKGDTLSEIAQRFHTSVKKLAAANGISNPDLIFAGASLKLASGGAGGSSSIAQSSYAGKGTGSWMAIARKYYGQHEYANGDNQFIVQCHATTTLGARSDEVPWCSSFVNRVMEDAGYKGTDSAAAMSWTKWGQNVGSLSNAREGDIVVINGSSGEHVGFFVRASNGRMTLLGGNQSDQVKESTYNLSSYRIVAVRRPPNVA
jgi:uncharacterized protein (TIGR02594 family)